MREVIAESFPRGTRVTRPSGGFVLWVQMPDGIDGMQLFEASLRQGVAVTPGSLFSPTRKFRNFIRVCCCLSWSEQVERAIATVGRTAGELHHAG